ncbi:ABC transporter substrate-binding protein [Mesobacillus foraminis]|uniref:ABC transporter substrate-binding protein n=1 Tax=Mesobacillus foraminis TaxID=279826 RepID=UPI000EF4BC9E|nr:ABC transporter substrate-binding protein [Mesobacillus foraminis]
MVKKRILLSIFLLLTLILSACGGSSENAGAGEGKKEPIKIGFSALPSWYLWHLVEEKGFFEKHGVEVELVWFPVYADSLAALNTGKVDGNSQALLDTITPLAEGIDLKAVFITDTSNGGDGLVSAKEISKIQDLKGKKIGTEIGTIEHFFMLTALKDAGMKESDVEFTNLAIADAGNAFLSGNLDAAGLWEPFLSKAVEKEGTHKLVTSAEYPGLISDVFAVRGEVAKEQKEEIEKVTAAWFEAVEYLKENPDESIKIMADAAAISAEEMKVGLEGFKIFTAEETQAAFKKGNTYQSFYYTAHQNAKFLEDLDFISEVPDFSKFVDRSFIEKELEQ